MQYMVGRVERVGKKMSLGKIFQMAWCDKKYDYTLALKQNGFNSDEARAMRNALAHERTVRLPKSKTEKSITVIGRGLNYPILIQLDGCDPDANLIVENKWGATWTQKRVDDGLYYDENKVQRQDRQITWYMLGYWIKYRRMPKFLLQSFNNKNGIPTHLWAKRYEYDLDKLVHDINAMVARVEAGDFE